MKKLLIIIFSAVSFVTYAQTETPAEPADSSPQVEEQGSARLGYRGSVSFGAMIHNGVLNPVLFTVHGGKVSPYLFLGAGIGLYFIHNYPFSLFNALARFSSIMASSISYWSFVMRVALSADSSRISKSSF